MVRCKWTARQAQKEELEGMAREGRGAVAERCSGERWEEGVSAGDGAGWGLGNPGDVAERLQG